MTSSTIVAPLISLQTPKDVSLTQIETELGDIWQTHGNPNESGTSLAAVRAATFTLIVYEPESTQQLLATLGYYRGPIDGIGGPRTEAAIRAAQIAYNLHDDGKTSPELVAKLQQELAVCRGSSSDLNLDGATCNMPAYAVDADGAGMADIIAAQNPCRIISLLPSSSDDDQGVVAQVSAYCPIQKHSQNAMVCCEYIMLKGAEVALDRIYPLVHDLLISNLPSYLWWKTTPKIDQTLFREISRNCTAVIIDSSQFLTDPEGDLGIIQQVIQSGIAVSDLNWKRLAPWQELAAEAFDHPDRWADLLNTDHVMIEYEHGNASQALLLLGWLASRPGLEWLPVSRSTEVEDSSDSPDPATSEDATGDDYSVHSSQYIALQSPDGRKIRAELTAITLKKSNSVVGDIVNFRIAAGNLQASTILCSEATGCTRLQQGTPDNSYLIQVTSNGDQAAEILLADQLRSWSRDLLYEESLTIATKIINLG
jgi:glucose-6-phosphate dehydrogenase assembly protein OpcA